MKSISFLMLLVLFLILFSCKKDSYTNASVVKVCGITFLRILDKDYKVCNTDKINSFDNNQKVLANFQLIKDCGDNRDQYPVCALVGPGAGWINIIDIKEL